MSYRKLIFKKNEPTRSLAGIKHEGETLTAAIAPRELSAYAAGLTLNDEDLVNRFNDIKGLFTSEKKKATRKYMEFLESYKANILLPSAAAGPSSSSSS